MGRLYGRPCALPLLVLERLPTPSGTTRPNGKIDNSDCENGSPEGSSTTTTLAVAPCAIDRFIGPLGYNCDSGRGQATFSWAVPNTGSVAFACDNQPHVVTFTWVEGSSPGVPIPGGPALTRSTTLTRTG